MKGYAEKVSTGLAASPEPRASRHDLVPVPISVAGVEKPVISLSGEWKFIAAPPAEFWQRDLDTSAWRAVEMPNEFATLGIAIEPNTEYPCRKRIEIPSDYEGQRIFLRFDGVYSYARVWVNGVFIRDHSGGFTSWDCEITDHVEAGKAVDLVLGITDRSDDISQASYYAKHLIGGILRGMRLFALPPVHLSSLSVSSQLDSQYENGVMRLKCEVSSPAPKSAQLHLKLTDGFGKRVAMTPEVISIGPSTAIEAQEVVVRGPKRWDSEHPDLYELETSVVVDGKVVETLQRNVGFRTVHRSGNLLLVNGQPVKLFGTCRHSIHPIYGRAVPAEFDEKDAALFRECNINFVRTSHYPPTEQFLDACDRQGIYVEEETAVCWSNVDDGPSSDPAFAERFLNQLDEMVQRDHGHASVLFWSLGNESQWGGNFALERKQTAELDSTRPMIFSFPDTVPLGTNAYDIYSKHYPDAGSDLSSEKYPLLNDEYAHVACYNLDTLRRDPGVRNFWGESIQRFGNAFIRADGCLGGSIWAGIDEVFLLPDGPAGYGPWGIIDGWRRPKPEYWLTRKAYSPIRVDDRPIALPQPGSVLIIPISNAFSHTNLREIEIRWAVGPQSGLLNAGDIPPHQAGYLQVPPRHWKQGEILELRFSAHGRVVDEFHLALDPLQPAFAKTCSAPAVLRDSIDEILVTGLDFQVAVNKATGLIGKATLKGEVVLEGGPFLDFGQGPLTSHWLLRRCKATAENGIVTIHTAGEAKRGQGIGTIPVEFEIAIDGCGSITTRYRAHANPTSYTQLGVSYVLPSRVDRLTWNRKSLWSVYPEDHIGRTKGTAAKNASHADARYRVKPEWPWSEDMEDFFLSGSKVPAPQATNDFRATKENIWYCACILAGSNIRVRAEAEANVATRASILPDGRVSFSLYNFWSYPDLAWGNYCGPPAVPALTDPQVKLRIVDVAEE